MLPCRLLHLSPRAGRGRFASGALAKRTKSGEGACPQAQARRYAPSPGFLRCARNPTSPRTRGEVAQVALDEASLIRPVSCVPLRALKVLDPGHRPRRIASKRCAKLASGFGHMSSSSIGGVAGSMGIVTITGSLANGSRPLVARTGSGGATAGTGSALATAGAGSVLATARTGLMTRARAGAPAFSGPYQQRLPCAMRYCQWPARSDAGGKVVRHSGNAGSTEHITLHASTAANAPRGIQPSIPSRFACLWRNALAPSWAHGGGRTSFERQGGPHRRPAAGGYATSALRRTPSVWCEESAERRGSAGHRGL